MKYGFKAGNQYYKCNDCRRKFAGTTAPEGMRFPTEIIGEAVGLFYDGLSTGEISWHLKAAGGISVDPATIWRWVIKYSRQADRILNRIKVNASSQWIIHETVYKICRMRVWFWDVIESESSFLLATHLTITGNKNSAIALLAEAKKRTTGIPKQIVSDGVTAYPDAIERLFGADSTHIKTKSLTMEVNKNIIKRFQVTVRERLEVMRGLRTMESAHIISKGFIIHNNFLRPHAIWKNETPARVAGLNLLFKTWVELVDYLWRKDDQNTGQDYY